MLLVRPQNGLTAIAMVPKHLLTMPNLLEAFAAASRKRSRRICLWLSSDLSGKSRNILYFLPSDVVKICGSYL
jgi:hypothetical protein